MQKVKSIKRIIVCFLIMFMVLSAIPVVSFADNSCAFPPEFCSPNYSVTPVKGTAYSRANVNLRYYPSTNAVSYGQLLYYTPLNVTGRTIGDDNLVWYAVTPLSGNLAGQYGYVRYDCLDFVESGASVGDVVS